MGEWVGEARSWKMEGTNYKARVWITFGGTVKWEVTRFEFGCQFYGKANGGTPSRADEIPSAIKQMIEAYVRSQPWWFK